jgi:rubrerythrin
MEKTMTNSMADLELKYHDITTLYDLAEELVETVESEFITDPDEQLAIVEPLIEQVGESADILSEEFLLVAGSKGKPSTASKKRIEQAMRKVYAAIEGYKKRVEANKKKTADSLKNIADPIVEKIKRQIEVCVTVFIEFIDISLDRIMQKAQIEELKKRQERIAIMLHEINLAAAERSR